MSFSFLLVLSSCYYFYPKKTTWSLVWLNSIFPTHSFLDLFFSASPNRDINKSWFFFTFYSTSYSKQIIKRVWSKLRHIHLTEQISFPFFLFIYGNFKSQRTKDSFILESPKQQKRSWVSILLEKLTSFFFSCSLISCDI